MTLLEHTDRDMPTSASASKQHYNKGHLWKHIPACMGPMEDQGAEFESDVLEAEPLQKTKRPSFYRVILLNDDYTPMDFVVNVLEQIFRKDHETAIEIMMAVHDKGAATVGTFTYDVAETKVDQVIEYARINDYPLQCVMEKE